MPPKTRGFAICLAELPIAKELIKQIVYCQLGFRGELSTLLRGQKSPRSPVNQPKQLQQDDYDYYYYDNNAILRYMYKHPSWWSKKDPLSQDVKPGSKVKEKIAVKEQEQKNKNLLNNYFMQQPQSSYQCFENKMS